MDKYFFNRIYSLTIGYPERRNEAREITGLRMAFDVTKSEIAGGNSCKITINNLSDETRGWIKEGTNETGTGGMTIILKAGYEEMHGRDNLPILFLGDITTVSHDVTKPEVATDITAYEGMLKIKNASFSNSYPAGAFVSQIVNDLIRALGVPFFADRFSFAMFGREEYKLNRAYNIEGNISDYLNKIGNGYGLRWSIQNNKVKIYNKINTNKSPGTDGKPAITQSVLIGSPRRLSKGQTATDVMNFGGYDFDCLLLPEAEPGGVVEISSVSIPHSPVKLGIAEVHHAGDTHGDEWKTTIKARKLDK